MDATLPEKEEIWGNNALSVLKRYGTKAMPTDLAVLLGCAMAGLDGVGCATWTASSYFENVIVVNTIGTWCNVPPYCRDCSIRPVLRASETSNIQPNNIKVDAFGIRSCTCGEYAQTVASAENSAELENLFQSKSLHLTGKYYTFDATDLKDIDVGFQAKSYAEFEHNGKKYIRVIGNPLDGDSRLSSGEKVEKGKAYWVCVEPIEWLMDDSGIWVSKKSLIAGVQFDGIANYLKNYFNYEMLSTDDYLKVKALQKGSLERKALARELFKIHREYDDLSVRKIVIANNLMLKKLREKAGKEWQ